MMEGDDTFLGTRHPREIFLEKVPDPLETITFGFLNTKSPGGEGRMVGERTKTRSRKWPLHASEWRD